MTQDVRIEWDDAKDRENKTKHGISLADAARLDWQIGSEVIDGRTEYGEVRMVRYALLDGRLHACVFTLRDVLRRIISLRKGNAREIRRHGKTQPPDE